MKIKNKSEENSMKKLLAAGMILMLSFSMFACGAKTPATDSDMPNQTEDQEQSGEDGAEIEVPDTIIPDGFAGDGEEILRHVRFRQETEQQ